MRTMLSTTDNPYNPYTQPDLWERFDADSGYYCNCLLARVCGPTDELSDELEEEAIEEAIDTIIAVHNGKIFCKIVEPKK